MIFKSIYLDPATLPHDVRSHASCAYPSARLLPQWCSSDPSRQSGVLSHCQAPGMQKPFAHKKLCSGHVRFTAAYDTMKGNKLQINK